MKILGIEFGAWSLKGVEMESRFRRLELLDLHEVRLPLEFEDPVAVYKEAVKKLMGRLPSHPDKLVTSVPAAQTALRFIDLPIKQLKKAEQSYRFELEDSVPFDLDETVVEHNITKTKDGSQVFAAVAPMKHLQSHLEWLNAVDVDPDWLTFEGMGLLNYYLLGLAGEKTEASPEDGATLLIDVGHLKTNFAFVHDKRLEFFRSIPWGGHAITQAISGALSLPLEGAEEAKIKELNIGSADKSTGVHAMDLYTAANQALQPLVTDTQHSMVTFKSLRKLAVKEILVTGGTSRIQGFDRFIENQLHRPTRKFEGFKSLSFGKELPSDKVATFAEAMGRAIVFARKAPMLFNFRKHGLAKGTSLTEVGNFFKNPKVLRLIKYSGALAAILFVYFMVATPFAETSSKDATKELTKTFRQTFTDVKAKEARRLTKDPKKLRKFIEKKMKAARDRESIGKKKNTPMLNLVRSVSAAFPKGTKVDVNTLEFTDRNFTIEGVLYEGDLNQVTETLKGNQNFDKVTLTMNNKRFTYRGEIRRN